MLFWRTSHFWSSISKVFETLRNNFTFPAQQAADHPDDSVKSGMTGGLWSTIQPAHQNVSKVFGATFGFFHDFRIQANGPTVTEGRENDEIVAFF